MPARSNKRVHKELTFGSTEAKLLWLLLSPRERREWDRERAATKKQCDAEVDQSIRDYCRRLAVSYGTAPKPTP